MAGKDNYDSLWTSLVLVPFLIGVLAVPCFLIYAAFFKEDEPLRPPGWICDAPGPQWRTAGCEPAPGYHFEKHGFGWAAVHDITRTPLARQLDLDIADGWELLTNDERQLILDRKARIYDFVERKEDLK
jgi:hypothetical protein